MVLKIWWHFWKVADRHLILSRKLGVPVDSVIGPLCLASVFVVAFINQ